MKIFLLLLAVSLTVSEKLDRTYLPPPGAKFSGGVPGNIEVPFEFPKYSPALRPQETPSSRPVTPEDSEIEVGINRGLGSQVPGVSIDSGITPGSKAPFDYYQKVPTTTTSYAFTQTTTHPPGEGFDTTLGPINVATGFPTTTPFVDFPTSAPGFVSFPQSFDQGKQIIPGYQPPNLITQQSGLGSFPGTIQSTGATAVTPSPGSPFVGQSRPGFIQGDLNQYQVDPNRPSVISTTGLGESQVSSQFPGQNLGQYQINQQPGTNIFGQQSTIAPSTSPQGFPQYGSNYDGVQVMNMPSSNIYPQGTISGSLPSGQYESVQTGIPSSYKPQSNLTAGQQLVPEGFVQSGSNMLLGQRPMQNQYQLNQNGETLGNIPQTQRPGQQQSKSRIPPQQYAPEINQSRRPTPGQDQIFSMTSPTTPVPNYSQFPSSTSSAFATTSPAEPFPSSPIYPGISDQVRSGLISRPERPQAESDRNAVILNYDNVITPEGYFAYSFDTSNGIHADESGTAADGVKANGSYSYIGDDGKLYSIVYTADENGFRPQGDHLPTPPPIPEAIQKVIEQVTRDKEAGISDDGTYDENKYGHKKFQGRDRPQKPKISDTDESQFDQIDRNQQVRPHAGSRKPTSSKEDIFKEYDEQDQPSDDDLDNQEKERPISKIPTRRPINKLPGKNEEKYALDLISGDGSDKIRPIGRLPSRRPTLRPDQSDASNFDVNEDEYESKQDGKFPSRRPEQSPSKVEDKITLQGNRRRPAGKLPSRKPSDQFDDFVTYQENSTYDEENDQPIFEPNEYRRIDKNMLRRPIPSINDQLSNQYVKSQADLDQSRFENIPEGEFDGTNRRVPERFPSRRPGTTFYETDKTIKTNLTKQPVTGLPTEGMKSYNKYNQNRGRPQVTTTFAPQTDDRHSTVSEKVSSFDQNEQMPTFEQKPTEIYQYTTDKSGIEQGPILASVSSDRNTNKPNTIFDDQNIRRPITSQRLRPNEYITATPNDSQESEINVQNEENPQFDSNRFIEPSKISTFAQTVGRPIFTQQPGQINQFAMTRPSTDKTLVSSPPNDYEFDDSQTFGPGKIYQTIGRPVSDQRPSQYNRYTTVKPIEKESGYQYLPPQRKFDDFPSVKKQQKIDFEHKEKVAKPFMTPNVNRYEEDFGDMKENRKQLAPSSRPGQDTNVNNPPLSQQEFEAYNQNEPNYYNVKDSKPSKNVMGINDLTRIPDERNKYSTTDSTRLPGYQQTTVRPQQKLDPQFEPNRTNYEEIKNIAQGTTRPPPKGTEYYTGRDKNRADVMPSSTPIPSQSTRFEVTQPIRRPGQQTDQYTTEKQDYNIISTTKMPLQEPGRLDVSSSKNLYQQTPSGPLYQTTYKPIVTISSNKNSNLRPDSEIFNIPGSQISAIRPGVHSQGKVPSTTYRPAYFTQTFEGEKRPTIDTFGRPTIGLNVTPGLEGTTIRPGTGGQNVRVPFTDDLRGQQPSITNDREFESEETKPGLTKYGRPITPSEQQSDDSTFFSPYEGSSSTEKIIGEDFSGPKQPQRFDPQRGYYY